MKINWLWDSRLTEEEARNILKDDKDARFDFYAEKLLSRISDPAIVFDLIDEIVFCKKWPNIKKRMKKDRWLKNRVVFWQTIYERVYEKLKKRGVKIRRQQVPKISPERMKIAQQIKTLRIKLGYTQKDIAKKLGVIQQYISRIESGRENVSLDSLKRIADVFDKRLIVKLR